MFKSFILCFCALFVLNLQSASCEDSSLLLPTASPSSLSNSEQHLSLSQSNYNHHFQSHKNKHSENYENRLEQSSLATAIVTEQFQPIFINQSNNMYILAKFGQTINLPCIIYRHKNPDLINVHAIWHKLVERQRPQVLSIGLQQLKQDMRYRVKVFNMNKSSTQGSKAASAHNVHNHNILLLQDSADQAINDNSENDRLSRDSDTANSNKYSVQNWSFEIRKLTYEDSATYQCLLPLVKPITKNITLQVIRKCICSIHFIGIAILSYLQYILIFIADLVVEPRNPQFKLDEKIVLRCRTTLKHHKSNGNHHNLNQRQPRPNIHWYKDNELIRSTSLYRDDDPNMRKIGIETKQEGEENLLNSVLTIHNARIEDSGNYKCIYENIQEQVSVKVIHDYFEYKNYLSSSTSKLNVCSQITALLLSTISFLVYF